jgi:ribosomal protein L22
MYREAGKLEKLADENESFLPELNADKKDTYLYVVSKIYEAVSLMYDKKVEEAIRCLNNLRYDVTLRHLPHAEMEVKLLTACGYAMVNEAELCTTLIKSIQRQIRNSEEEMDGADYEDARIMLKILTKMVNFRENKQVDKVEQLIERFERNNKGEKAVIPYFDTHLLLKYY